MVAGLNLSASGLFFIERVFSAKSLYAGFYSFLVRVEILDYQRDHVRDLDHILFLETARCNGRRTKPDTACYKRALGVVWYRVLVAGYADLVELCFDFFTGLALLDKAYQHEMVVRAAGYYLDTSFLQSLGESRRVDFALELILLKFCIL